MKTFKLRSGFGLTLLTMLFFLTLGLLSGVIVFYALVFLLGMLLPSCSTKS